MDSPIYELNAFKFLVCSRYLPLSTMKSPDRRSRHRGPSRNAHCFIIRDVHCLAVEHTSITKSTGPTDENIMRPTVCAFATAILICAAAYETCHAAPIAPLTAIQGGPGNITLVYSRRYRIIVPLMRNYGWWPQGQYRWFPFGLARWGYWCEPASYHRLNCGVGD